MYWYLIDRLHDNVTVQCASLRELRGTLFNPDRCYPYTMPDCGKADLHKAWAFWGGYQGPYMPPGVEAAWV
jgi:hypothetical protein